HAVTLTAQWEEVYSVTYVFGSFGSTEYAGNSVLPTETDKVEGATFDLAAAPVWDGYTFNGWNDGENIYEAGEEYTMPDHAVTLTAQWYNCPEGYLRSSVEVPTWNQSSTTGYTIEKGQYLQLSASFSGKSLEGSEWAGIVSKIYRNCDYSVVGTFYQFRPDFAVDRRDWGNWVQDNRDFYVTDTNWNEDDYVSLVGEADVLITVELSEQGVLTYTIELTSANYNYTRVFSPKNATMNRALVIFGADGCTASNATLVSPMPSGVKLLFDWGYDDVVDLKVARENSTYTFEADAVRDGYLFLGWQVNGAGDYYKGGDTYSVGTKQVRFVAAWEEDPYTEGLVFTELADGTYAVKKGTANAATVIIPRTYHNKPVTEIGSNAFMSAKWLEQIEIPDTVTTIGASAFEGATMLKHIELPDTVTTINGRAFHSTGLEEIVIPDGVTIIAVSTFYNCASLTSVTLPNGLVDVQTDAFAKCTALQGNEAGNAVYLGSNENPYIVLIKAKDTSITECDIQNGCMMIYYQAFNKCTQLSTVTFPASLKMIGGQAFNGCRSLTT
ncbi:MAG: leucine-rich repeat protein, partial [Clostridiales bacterium]|nr:leucine-rich repeat protein [Clostridiales bacterium]